VSYRLKNQNDPCVIVRMNNWTWFGLLELAEKYGWNPMGTIHPNGFELAGFHAGHPDEWRGDYWSADRRLVLLEDALNLADALDEAFLDYEPRRLPSLHSFWLNNEFEVNHRRQPGIGAIKIVVDFCQSGAFFVEKV
jgi:hypothetical protein